mgnify:CR=1 FL=1
MIIQAELKCKQTGCEADPCAVDKVIELPSPRFKQFSRALQADYDFIAENKNAIRHDGAPDTACSSSMRMEQTVSSLTHRGTTMPGTVPLSPTPAVC